MSDWREVLRCDPCSYCGRPAGGVDHIDARTKDNDVDENLTGVCMSCNSSKGRRTLLEFLPRRRERTVPSGFSSLAERFDIPPEINIVPTRGWTERAKAKRLLAVRDVPDYPSAA